MKKYYTLLLLFSWACIQAQVQKSWEKVYTDFNPRNAKVNTDLKGNVQWLQSTDSALHFRLIQTDGTMLHHFEWKDSSAMTYRIAAPQRNASGATFFAAVTELYGGGETMNLFCLNDSAQLVWRYSAPVPSTLTCVPHDLAITQQHNYVLWNFSGFEKESWYLQKFDFQGQQTASLSSDTTRNQRALWLLAQEHQLRIAGQEMYQDLNKTFQIVSDTSLSITQSQSISLFNSHEYLADYLLYSDSARVYAINLESDSTGLDFAIAYQHEDSTQNWLFYYDGLAGYDDAVSGLASIGRRLFAAGYTTKLENAQLHKDYLLLCMSDDGQLIWEAHYDGPPGQMDDAELQIATDELDRIWVSGASYNGLNYDMFTCVYDTEGSLLYNFRYALDGDKDERPFRMIKDKVGGMILAGKSESDSTSHILLRYGDEKEKQQAIEKQLALLAAALVLPMQDTLIKSIVWKYVEKSYTDLWYVFIDEIVRDAEALNYPILSEMNKSVSWFFDLPPKDYVSPLLKRFYVDGRPYRPFIYVVEADSLSRQQWMDSIPWIAFSHQRDSMPVMAVSRNRDTELPLFEPIDGVLEPWGGTNSRPILELAILPNDWVRRTKNKKILINCFARKPDSGNCLFCFRDNYPIQLSDFSSSTMDDEIQINLAQNMFNNNCFDDANVSFPFSTVEFLHSQNISPSIGDENDLLVQRFAILEAVSGNFSFYKSKLPPAGEGKYIVKTDHPIWRRVYPSGEVYKGHALTLCNKYNNFKDLGEYISTFLSGSLIPQQELYGLAVGGLYRIYVPNIQVKPLYFSFPYNKCLWYQHGPDMKIDYELAENDFECLTPPVNSADYVITDNFKHGGSAFRNAYEQIYQTSGEEAFKYVLNTNLNQIREYWETNRITVYFSSHSGALVIPENVFRFIVSNDEFNELLPSDEFITSFTLNQQGEYEVFKNSNDHFNPFYTALPGDNIVIEVVAKFENSENIICRKLVQLQGQNILEFKTVGVEITGKIRDFDEHETIYSIKLWKRN
jgi:hypothetical protein